MKRYRGVVVFRYYQSVEVEAESADEAKQSMYSAFSMNRADGESEVQDFVEVVREECPSCDPCNPEMDEQGRPYTCFACGDTGWVNVELTEKEQI
jgi:hypothetical protein